jgi:hypothetical protein
LASRGLQFSFPKFDGIPIFSALGPIQGHNKAQRLLVTWGRLKFFFGAISAFDSLSVKPLGLISTFPPIGMLDLR